MTHNQTLVDFIQEGKRRKRMSDGKQLGSGEDGGDKFDGDKLRTDLMSTYALEGLSQVLTHGAKKYADRNWEEGIAWNRVYGAALRHLFAFWSGSNTDIESGLFHIDHAACCIHFLQHYARNNLDKDNRPYYGGKITEVKDHG